MGRFIARRIGLIFVTLFVISIVVFLITEILPGDAATAKFGKGATEQNLKTEREKLGLDRPAPVRYIDWIGGVVTGDFGESLIQGRAVTEIVKPKLGNSLILAVFAFLIAVPSAVAVGIWAGVKHNSLGDHAVGVASLVAISMPEFVTGVLLIVVFSSFLGVLPSSSVILPGTSPFTRPEILVLPTLTLTGVLFAYIMRMTRANVIEVLETHYVRTAILKGLSMRRVIFRHVFPNAMLPTISVIAVNIGWMLGGLIIVESVFAYPGLGQLVLNAIETRDVPLLQSLALIIAATYALSNLVADLSYGALDPRIRLS
jgi:peptide/nickel transport system permease protein